MCWRDEVARERRCVTCGNTYYGDLGHRGCPGFNAAQTGRICSKCNQTYPGPPPHNNCPAAVVVTVAEIAKLPRAWEACHHCGNKQDVVPKNALCVSCGCPMKEPITSDAP